ARLAEDSPPAQREFWPALIDPRVLLLGIAYVAIGAGGYGIRIWLPQIVQGMGFSDFATRFVVAVPHAAPMLAMVLSGRSRAAPLGSIERRAQGARLACGDPDAVCRSGLCRRRGRAFRYHRAVRAWRRRDRS